MTFDFWYSHFSWQKFGRTSSVALVPAGGIVSDPLTDEPTILSNLTEVDLRHGAVTTYQLKTGPVDGWSTEPFAKIQILNMFLTLSLPRVINVKFLLQPHQKITSHSKENLAFYRLLRWKTVILPILTTSPYKHFSFKGWANVHFERGNKRVNTFTPKGDQIQISPVASPVILHHTVWRTWLFIAYSDWKMILVPVLTTSLIHFSWKGWENVHFELGGSPC